MSDLAKLNVLTVGSLCETMKSNYRTSKPDDSDSDSDHDEDLDHDSSEDHEEADLIEALVNLEVKEIKEVKEEVQEEVQEPDIYKAIEMIRSMKYFKNEAATSGKFHKKHEEAVAAVLIKTGFNKFKPEKKLKQKEVIDWMSNPKNSPQFPVGSFIEQPLGSNNSPDFLVKISENCILPVEAKSSAQMYPMYNSGGIKSNYLYVFCSKKPDQTTIFMGEDIITTAQNKLIEAHIKKVRLMDEELNKNLALLDVNKRGVSYYTRPMIQQKGGAKYVNYFTHTNRKIVENKTVAFIKRLLAL